MRKKGDTVPKSYEITHEILEQVSKLGLSDPDFFIKNQQFIYDLINQKYKGKVVIKDIRDVDEKGVLIKDSKDDVVKEILQLEEDEKTHNTVSGYYIRYLSDTELPIQSCMIMDKKPIQRLHNVIVVDKGVKASMLSGCTLTMGTLRGEHRSITEIFLQDGAYLNYTMIHEWGEDTKVYPRTIVHVGKGAKLVYNYINLRRASYIQSMPKILVEEGGVVESNTLLYVDNSNLDLGTEIRLSQHAKAKITSRAVFKSGKLISRGRIIGNQKSSGHNSCDVLMLGDGEVQSIPELVSLSRDAQLSHEAAIGKLSDMEIEYLMSRGLTKDEAVSLIVRGFLDTKILGLSKELSDELDDLVKMTTSENLL